MRQVCLVLIGKNPDVITPMHEQWEGRKIASRVTSFYTHRPTVNQVAVTAQVACPSTRQHEQVYVWSVLTKLHAVT